MILIILFFPILLFANTLDNAITNKYKTIYPNIKITKIIYSKKISQKIISIDTSLINTNKPNGIIKINNSIFLSYKITAYLKVLKTTQVIHKGDIINHSNTALCKIKFKNFYSIPLLTHPKDMMSTSYIPKNKIIYSYMVSKPFLIKRGDMVQIVSKSGNIEITLQGIALQNGKKGDSIKVKINSTTYNVVVIGVDKARL